MFEIHKLILYYQCKKVITKSKMNKKLKILSVFLLTLIGHVNLEQWSVEKAQEWYKEQGK